MIEESEIIQMPKFDNDEKFANHYLRIWEVEHPRVYCTICGGVCEFLLKDFQYAYTHVIKHRGKLITYLSKDGIIDVITKRQY